MDHDHIRGPIASIWLHSNGSSLYEKPVCLSEAYVKPMSMSQHCIDDWRVLQAERWALIGNAVTVPVAKWLGERLMQPYRYLQPTYLQIWFLFTVCMYSDDP